MTDPRGFARYLEENGWHLEYVAENDLRWVDPVTGRGYARFRPALKIQMNRKLDVAVDAMLRLPALEAKLARIAALVDSMHHNSLEEPESGSLCVDHGDFNALREEVTHG